jgi:Acyl-ACP thioesterase
MPRYSELDKHGELTPTALLGLFEETAVSHCDEANWSVYRLVSEGYGWVLLRGGFEMARYPVYGESFIVETWFSAARRFYGSREYRLRSSSGEELGWARSLWVFFSLERKRPVPIFDEILEKWAADGTSAGPMELPEISFPESASSIESPSFEIRRSDIDTNGHVNNVNYLAWALEAMDAQLCGARRLAYLRGQFKREVTYGSTVSPVLAKLDGDGSYAHAIYAAGPEGRYLAATAESRWLPRDKAARISSV